MTHMLKYEQKSTYMIVGCSVKHTDNQICLWPLTDVYVRRDNCIHWGHPLVSSLRRGK